MEYKINISGLDRNLPICRVNDDLYIGAFIMFGDVELTEHCATELLKKAPDFDYIVTPEAKSIPLAYEMSKQSGKPYIVARKMAKAYMKDTFVVHVKSITTMNVQTLVLDSQEAAMLNGKKILIVDDVISTGESLKAVEELVNKANGNIVAKMAPLAEGDACKRGDITFLAELPLFDKDGNIL